MSYGVEQLDIYIATYNILETTESYCYLYWKKHLPTSFRHAGIRAPAIKIGETN